MPIFFFQIYCLRGLILFMEKVYLLSAEKKGWLIPSLEI